MYTVFDVASYDIGAHTFGVERTKVFPGAGACLSCGLPGWNAHFIAPVVTSKPRTTPTGLSSDTLSATRAPPTTVVPAMVGGDVSSYSGLAAWPRPSLRSITP